MKVLTALKRLLPKPRKPIWLIEHSGKIKPAFTHNGTNYFMFDDVFATPTVRAMQALDFYDEFSMRCTKEFLLKYCEAVEVILSNPKKLDLVKLATITGYLRERVGMIPVPDQIYRLASVVFFDGSENPYFYDRNYAEQKIERWKKDPEMLSFFLQTPLKDLIPFFELQRQNLSIYSGTVEMLNNLHRNAVLSILSQKGTKVAM